MLRMRMCTKVPLFVRLLASGFCSLSFAARVLGQSGNGGCHRAQQAKVSEWRTAHSEETIPKKTKCLSCLQARASGSANKCKFCPRGGAARDGAAAECFSIGGNSLNPTSRCETDFAIEEEQCNDVFKKTLPEGWESKTELFSKGCRMIAGSGSDTLTQEAALAQNCNWGHANYLAQAQGEHLNRGGHMIQLLTAEEIVLDLSTGQLCTKVNARTEGLCGKGKEPLWQQASPMAWVNLQVTGQITCAGFFLTDSARKYVYAIHANAGVLHRLPSQIINEMKWKNVNGEDVKKEELVALYVVGASSARGGVPDDGTMIEIQKLVNDGVLPENIHIGMYKGNGVSNSQLTLLREDDGQWNAFWGGI